MIQRSAFENRMTEVKKELAETIDARLDESWPETREEQTRLMRTVVEEEALAKYENLTAKQKKAFALIGLKLSSSFLRKRRR